MRRRLGIVTLFGLLAAGFTAMAADKPAATPAAAPAAKPAAADAGPDFKKASVDGKYRMLLAQFKVEKDREQYGAFRDLGPMTRSAYAGKQDLPKGHWVYAAPYYYIWRDLTATSRSKRAWGPEQVTGPPDTDNAGDIQTAWASQSQDGQDEWLLMEYAEPVSPAAVLVHETYNPGAVVRVTAFRPDGQEVELWKGQDPTATDSEIGVSEIPVKVDFKTNRVKVYIDSRTVPGWNEIDAVGLRDKDKKVQWAVAVEASSTFAPPYEAMPAPLVMPRPPVEYENRIRALEMEVRQLKQAVEELKSKVNKPK